MRVPPADLRAGHLADTLERHWSLSVASLEYLPVGFGSHHWEVAAGEGSRRFVTVDTLESSHLGADPETAFAALAGALETARLLRDEDALDFVVGPIRSASGPVVHRLSARYAVSVFPFVEGRSAQWGRYDSRDERRAVLAVLGRLHSAGAWRRAAAEPTAPTARSEDFAIPRLDGLLAALRELTVVWASGPFGEPTRRLLRERESTVRIWLDEYDELSRAVRSSRRAWVLTHGEPHRANVIRGDDTLFLVDWDTARVAPRERDLWMVLDDERVEWDAYLATAGDVALDERVLAMYRVGWTIADVAAFVGLFRARHERTADTELAWKGLNGYLAGDDAAQASGVTVP